MKKIEIGRSSVTGRFVTKKFVTKHPKTTEMETIKRK